MKSGSMMLRDGVMLPKSLPLEMYRRTQGWRTVSGIDKLTLERKLSTVGWNLLFVAGEIKSISVWHTAKSLFDEPFAVSGQNNYAHSTLIARTIQAHPGFVSPLFCVISPVPN